MAVDTPKPTTAEEKGTMQVLRQFDSITANKLESMPIGEIRKRLGIVEEQKTSSQPSKWAKISQRVKENPISLGDYSEEDERIRREFRENLTFNNDL